MSNKLISKVAKSEIVFNLIEEIKQAKVGVIKGFLVMGKNLDKIQKEKLWTYYADHLEDFNSFLREIRVGISTAYNCMAIWRQFGELLISKNLEIDYFRLVKLLPVAKEEDKEDWLIKAQELDSSGFNNEIREAKGLVPTDKCEHDGDKIYLERCQICGRIRKVGLEELCKVCKKYEVERKSKR